MVRIASNSGYRISFHNMNFFLLPSIPTRHLLVFSKEESNEQIVLTPRETIKFKILR